MASNVKDQKESEGTPAPTTKSSSLFGFNFFEFSEGFQLTSAGKDAMSEDNSDDSDETSDSCSSDEETITSEDTDTGTDTDTYSNCDTNTADEEETAASIVRNQRGCINSILGSNDGYGPYNDEKTVEDMNSYVYESPIVLRKNRAVLPGRINKYSFSQDDEQNQTNKVETTVASLPSVTSNDAFFQQLFSTEIPAKNVEQPVEKVPEMEPKKVEKKASDAAATQKSKRKRWRLFQRKKKNISPKKASIPGKLPQARSSKKAVSRKVVSEKGQQSVPKNNAVKDTTSDGKDATVKETVGSFEQSKSPSENSFPLRSGPIRLVNLTHMKILVPT
jgi:hypothetical protein